MGHRLTPNGIKPEEDKTEAIQNITQPTNATEIRSFLGLVNFCNRFIQNYSTISEPLRRLTRKDQPFNWGKEQQDAFIHLKQAIQNPEVMTILTQTQN